MGKTRTFQVEISLRISENEYWDEFIENMTDLFDWIRLTALCLPVSKVALVCNSELLEVKFANPNVVKLYWNFTVLDEVKISSKYAMDKDEEVTNFF